MTITSILAPLLSLFGLMSQAPAAPPQAEISNSQIRMKLYLPDARNGFYRGTRFDWAGVIASLEYQGHNVVGPWFTRSDPKVHDFIYDGPDIIASSNSAMTGPAEEFTGSRAALGFAEAGAGGIFIKIGVGVLRKPDAASYSQGSGATRWWTLESGPSTELPMRWSSLTNSTIHLRALDMCTRKQCA